MDQHGQINCLQLNNVKRPGVSLFFGSSISGRRRSRRKGLSTQRASVAFSSHITQSARRLFFYKGRSAFIEDSKGVRITAANESINKLRYHRAKNLVGNQNQHTDIT